jgi:pantoate kinase
VLQASQVEVGISRKETESNAGSIGTSQTVKAKVKVKVKLELDTGSRESGQTGQTNKGIMTEERMHKLNKINITI